jgi:hypothetical protein
MSAPDRPPWFIEAVLIRADAERLRVRVPFPPPETFTLARYPGRNRTFELTSDVQLPPADRYTAVYIERYEDLGLPTDLQNPTGEFRQDCANCRRPTAAYVTLGDRRRLCVCTECWIVTPYRRRQHGVLPKGLVKERRGRPSGRRKTDVPP